MNKEEQRDAERRFNQYKNTNISEEDIRNANKKAGKLGEQKNNFLLLLSMMRDCFSGKFSISNIDKGIIIGAILYVVSPIDAIPDIIPFVGWLDDIGIVSLAFSKLAPLISRYKNQISKS